MIRPIMIIASLLALQGCSSLLDFAFNPRIRIRYEAIELSDLLSRIDVDWRAGETGAYIDNMRRTLQLRLFLSSDSDLALKDPPLFPRSFPTYYIDIDPGSGAFCATIRHVSDHLRVADGRDGRASPPGRVEPGRFYYYTYIETSAYARRSHETPIKRTNFDLTAKPQDLPARIMLVTWSSVPAISNVVVIPRSDIAQLVARFTVREDSGPPPHGTVQ